MELLNTNNNSIHAFKKSGLDVPPDPEVFSKDETDTEPEKGILCRVCANYITKPADRIHVNGRHSHTFTNPAGIEYQILCFSSAEGCLLTGEPTSEFTWFPGYHWRCAFCSQCISHIGWHYISGSDSFFGIILDAVTWL